jgi:hypothetical protein
MRPLATNATNFDEVPVNQETDHVIFPLKSQEQLARVY